MVFTVYKNFRRLRAVLWSGTAQLSFSLFNLLASLLVIRLSSAELWGDFVNWLLIVIFAAHLLNFANREFLFREFTKNPAALWPLWWKGLFSRALFFPVIAAILLVPGLNGPTGWLTAWILTRFLYQSFDAQIVFQKKFHIQAIAEALGFLAFLSLSLATPTWTETTIVHHFFLAELVKLLVMITVFFSRMAKGISIAIDLKYYVKAFPFFITGLAGLVQSRIDLLAVTALLSGAEVAIYQVLTAFFLLLQSGSQISLNPLLKGLYRSSRNIISKIIRNQLLLGMIVCLAGLPLIYFFLEYFYQLEFPVWYLAAGLLMVLPIYYYSPIIYYLYKSNCQNLVTLLVICGIFLNLVITWGLAVKFGLNGALWGAGVTKIIMLVVYGFLFRRG